MKCTSAQQERSNIYLVQNFTMTVKAPPIEKKLDIIM